MEQTQYKFPKQKKTKQQQQLERWDSNNIISQQSILYFFC